MMYRSYAKLNLYLDVLGRRTDGYHDIETVFQTVSLFDTLSYELRPEGVSLECSGADLDCGEGNLVCRAARLLQDRTGTRAGVQVRLEKRIPIAAGLAGGSGNAAATLVALNRLWDLGLDADRLRELALELGSDVPYCLVGGTMAATGRGESLRPLPPLHLTWFVLIHPAVKVSTAAVYASPDMGHTTEKPVNGLTPSFREALGAIESGDFGRAVFNRMEGPVFAELPALAEAKDRLAEAGCLASAMSGSGPTLFGICRSEGDAARVANLFPDYATSVVTTIACSLEFVH